MEESMLFLLEEFAKYEPYLKEHYENANERAKGTSRQLQETTPGSILIPNCV